MWYRSNAVGVAPLAIRGGRPRPADHDRSASGVDATKPFGDAPAAGICADVVDEAGAPVPRGGGFRA